MATRDRQTERGAALVEFVLVVPLLLMLFFGLISYGVMLSFRQTLSQAAVEGARAAAVAPSNLTYSQRRDRAIQAINDSFVNGFGGTLTCGGTLVCNIPSTPTSCGDATQCISVTLQYAYRDNPRVVLPVFLNFTLPQTLTYTASARIN